MFKNGSRKIKNKYYKKCLNRCDSYQNALSFDYLNLLLANFSTKDYHGFL